MITILLLHARINILQDLFVLCTRIRSKRTYQRMIFKNNWLRDSFIPFSV